jgi:hypothetical protein
MNPETKNAGIAKWLRRHVEVVIPKGKGVPAPSETRGGAIRVGSNPTPCT